MVLVGFFALVEYIVLLIICLFNSFRNANSTYAKRVPRGVAVSLAS
jgi:hypothetical protein